MASISERTFIAIKPDGVQRGLVGEIIKRFEQKGFKLVAMKLINVSFLQLVPLSRQCHPFHHGLLSKVSFLVYFSFVFWSLSKAEDKAILSTLILASGCL